MEYLLTFPNTHYAVLAEQVLLARKVAVRVFYFATIIDGWLWDRFTH